MSRKMIVMVIAAALVLTGGFFVIRQIQANLAHQAYLESSDKVADDFINALIGQDSKSMLALYSTDLKANYSEGYWKTYLLPIFKDYKGQATLHAKGPVQPVSAKVPNRYDPRFKQQATQYDYDFQIRKLRYRLSIVVFRQANAWKINEVNGGYQR